MKKLLGFILSILAVFSCTFAINQPTINSNITRQTGNSFYSSSQCRDGHEYYITSHNYVGDSFFLEDTFWANDSYYYIFDTSSTVEVIDPYNVFNFNGGNNFTWKSNGKPTESTVEEVIFVQKEGSIKTGNILNGGYNGGVAAQIAFRLKRGAFDHNWVNGTKYYITRIPYGSTQQQTDYWHLKQHNDTMYGGLECFNYIVHYCGDGVRDTQASMAALGKNNSVANEQCDSGPNNGQPGYCNTSCNGYVPTEPVCGNGILETGEDCEPSLPSSIPSGYSCNSSCQLVQNPEPPACHSQYNGQTTYTTNGNPILNDSSSYLCEEGTPNNFSVSWTFGDPNGRHFTWKCSQSGYSSAYCSAYQKWCGDGVINSGSEDCEQYSSGHWGGCNTNCKLKDPSCTLTADPTQGSIPFTTNISGSTNDWWARVVYLNFGDGQTVGNGWDSVLPQSHTYSTVNTFYLTGTVINTHTPVRTGVTRPVNYCSVSVSTTTPPTPPTPLTGLSIEKEQISTGTMEAGSLVVYRIIARNTGTIAITGVSIYDVLPKELQYISSSISIVPTSTYHFTHGTVNIGGYTRAYILYTGITLEANGTATVYLTGMVKNGQTFNALTNCATVSGTNAQPQEDCVTVTPPTPPTPLSGLSIVKEQISTGTMEAGATVAYKIVARNTGSIAITGVTIYDALPKELQYISSSISIVPTSTYHFTHGTVNIGGYTRAYILYTGITLNANGTATVYLTGKVKNGQTFNALTNCAIVSGTNAQPQEDCVTVTPPTPPTPPTPYFLKQQRVGNTPFTTSDIIVHVGDTIRYKLNFGNLGTTPATGKVRDILPPCLQYQTSSIVGVNTYNFSSMPYGNQWLVMYKDMPLAAGQTGYMLIKATVKGDGQCANTTTYVNVGHFTLDGVEITGDVVAKRPVPYVKKWQRLSGDAQFVDTLLHVDLGQYIQYKVDFKNNGSVGATGEVKDVLPNCVQFVSANLHLVNGTGPTTGYELGNMYVKYSNIYLTPGQSGYMLVLGKIKSEAGCQDVSRYVNTGMFHFMNGPWLTSDVVAERDNTTDVEITKEVSPAGPFQAGDVVTYTITYRNNGPEVLQSYTIVDYWPNDKLQFSGVVSPSTPQPDLSNLSNNMIRRVFNTPLNVGIAYKRQIIIQGIVR